ncbi:MAG: PAS domain S-box protein [Spirulina sp. DLM2.Bin59]|nr:MAG: PAS domain S-box protein [Spirulina sp. DLM2.Bin59]
MIQMLLRIGSSSLKQLPLRVVLVVPFVVQLFAAVGIVGYLSYRNGQQAVENLANQLMGELGDRITQEVSISLAIPHQINRTNAESIRLGLLDYRQTADLERQFWQQVQIFDTITASYFGNPQGGLVLAGRNPKGLPFLRVTTDFATGDYHRYTSNERGERLERIETTIYDATQRPWYIAAQTHRRPIWSDIYLFVSTQTPGITASQPIYDDQGELIGILGVDLALNHISDFLQELTRSQERQVFIMERSGKLIASSTDESPFLPESDQQRLAMASTLAPIQGAARHLVQEFGSLRNIDRPTQLQFTIEGEHYFLKVLPLRDDYGLDWLVAIVVPEQEFTAQIGRNTKIMILLCAVALLVATGVGILTAHWVTAPILRLSQSAKQLAQGDWSQAPSIERGDELGELAIAFQTMAKQLQSSFTVLERSNQALEERVAERTATLAVREAELRGLFEAMTELVMVFDREGHYKQILSNNVDLLVREKETVIGRTLHEMLPPELANQFLGHIQTVLNTGTPMNFEYQMEIQNRPEPVWCSGSISRISQNTVVWVARDISDYKQAEASLRQSEMQNRAILTAIPDMMFRVNRNGVYLGFIKSYGVVNLLPDEFDPIGQHITNFLPTDVAQRHLAHITKALASGQVQIYEQRIFLQEQWQEEEVRVVPYGENEVLFMIRNITEQKAALREREKAQAALRESEAKNRAILTAIPDLMIRLSREGFYLDYLASPDFPARIAPEGNRLGRHISEVLPPDSTQVLMSAISQVLATGKMQIDEVQFVSDGEFYQQEVRTVVNGEDEVLMIIRDITERKRTEARLHIERERAEKLLLNVLPKAIAEQLKQKPGSLAEQFEDVTVLFADIVGFTPLSAQMEAIELVEFLNEIFSMFDQLTERFNLEKIKTIGDAYMVVGGLPSPCPNHTAAIAAMALAMQQATDQLVRSTGKPLQIRIGIHSGSVVAGVIGIKKFIYDLWGDAVNVASRMESLGEPGKIQVTERVYQRLSDRFTFTPRGTVTVKGKGEMRTYWLTGDQGQPWQPPDVS